MIRQQETAYADFICIIANSKDLHMEQKISILQYAADEMYCRDENLLYLECKQALKELHGQEADRNITA